MATGKGNKKKNEERYRTERDATLQAYQASPEETARRARLKTFRDDIASGKDIGDIEYTRPYLNLYNAASRDDPSLAGEGLLGNNALVGANSNVASRIGEQLKSRRQQDAAGSLYNTFNAAQEAATRDEDFLIGTEQGRMGDRSRLYDQRFTSYMNRPRPGMGLLGQIIGGGLGAAGSIFTGAGA